MVAEVTDSKTVQTVKGPRQLCYPAGWPDITAVLPVIGRLWAIECKTEDGKLRPEQEDRLPELEASGALVTIARDLTDVSSELKRQLEMLPKGAYIEYIQRMRQIWQETAERAAQRELQKSQAKRRQQKV
ncbi:MAG TPA: VRR-NUC domain-containing protein [Pyrinomonadaceae bacterium]